VLSACAYAVGYVAAEGSTTSALETQFGCGALLCGAREQPEFSIKQGEFEAHLGPENLCINVEEALSRAREFEEAALARAATQV
jgi:hypothetical protein